MGKTTLAAAFALSRAMEGEAVLVVSTDPAHSLGDALGARLGPAPRALELPGGEALWAVELAAPAAYEAWMDERREALRQIAERGTLLSAQDVDHLLALPLPGVDELLGLLEVLRLGRHHDAGLVVVDTAPTAHTLRLMEMPQALRRVAAVVEAMLRRPRVLAEHFGGGGPLEGDALLEEIEGLAAEAEELLRDPARCTIVWVALPETLAVAETARAVQRLADRGIPVAELVVNRLSPQNLACPVCTSRHQAEGQAVARLERRLPGLRLTRVPALPTEPRGRKGLLRLATAREEEATRAGSTEARREATAARPADAGSGQQEPQEEGPAGFSSTSPRLGSSPGSRLQPPDWLHLLAPEGLKLLFFGGKGGVGKTTCSASLALLVAQLRPASRIEVLSTDPAHSLGDTLGMPLADAARQVPGAPPNLTARELDAEAHLRELRDRHRQAVEELFSSALGPTSLDAPLERELLESLLEATPPGLDELVALASLLDTLGEPEAPDLLVVDTAPTGHALRLLELPELALRWDRALMEILLRHREALALGRLAQELLALSRSLQGLIRALRDPSRCRFAAVTLASELPRRETLRLLAALEGMNVSVAAVLVNAVSAGQPDCRRCRRRAEAQQAQIHKLARGLGSRPEAEGPYAILQAPERLPPPQGPAELARWAWDWAPGSR